MLATRSMPAPDLGMLQHGTVLGFNSASRTYQVRITEDGRVIDDAVWAVGSLFGPLFGYSVRGCLEEGTRVIILEDSKTWIIGCVPTSLRVSNQGVGRVGLVEPAEATGPVLNQAADDTPADMLDGEFLIENAFGAGIEFLTTMIRTRAGRAAIEVCLLDDAVRLMAPTWELFTALGETRAGDDGRPTSITRETSYTHEVLGNLSPTDAAARFSREGIPDMPTAADLLKTGRYRFEQYRGFLGDFINSWVMDPETVLGNLASQGVRSGKSRHWAGADGTLLWQSVSEIVLERVVRIPIPSLTARPPASFDWAGVEKSFLKLWETGANFQDVRHTTFQLREYARWLSQFASLARFHQRPDIYTTAAESATPAPSPNSHEADRDATNPGASFTAGYSCIRLLRSGGVLVMDHTGGTILLQDGDGTIAVRRNLFFEAGADIRFTAGRDIWMKARGNVSVISLLGRLVHKARTGIHALAEAGAIWLKSDASDVEAGDLRPVTIEAVRGSTLVTGGSTVVASTALSGSTKLQAAGAVIATGQSLVASSDRGLDISLRQSLVLRASSFAGFLTSRRFNLSGMLDVVGGRLTALAVSAGSVLGRRGIAGPSRYVSNVDPSAPEVAPTTLDPIAPPESGQSTPVLPDRPLWEYPETAQAELFESPAQQALRIDGLVAGYSEHDETEETLRPAPGTREASLPAPAGAPRLIHPDGAGQSLNTPSNIAPNAQNAQTALTSEPPKFYHVNDS